MKIAKILMMFLLILAGIFFLYYGCGGKISKVEYHGVTARDVPIGLLLVISAIALGKFWRIEEKTTTREVIKDGGKEWIRTTSSTIKTISKKPWE
jgi:hypothetical protein